MAVFPETDRQYMQQALELAAGMLGKVSPNPAVGCVLVKDDVVIGQGSTAMGGRPHAETQALLVAGDKARGATAYVTLEPCAHHGKTPPCAEALISAGVARVVIACLDPDPRVNGKGIAAFKAAGIIVETGLCEVEAQTLNAGFFKRVKTGQPFVTLKVATSLDGMIATDSGESKWITGEEARAEGHRQRSIHDAILTGIGTVLADDPQLTVRVSGIEQSFQPLRVILDTDLKTPLSSHLVRSAKDHPVLIVCGEEATSKKDDLEGAGVTVCPVPRKESGLDIAAVLSALGERGVTRLLVEGGAKVITSFIQTGCFDRLLWFRAPSLIGAEGIPAIGPLALEKLALRPQFVRKEICPLGEDVLEIYKNKD